MGIYLNPGNENFTETTRARIYVDKTGMISVINRFMDEGNKLICVSRPRRFGKTMAGNMLCAYYSRGCDSAELFAPYSIATDPEYEIKLNKYNVLQIDMNSEYRNIAEKDELLHVLTQRVNRELCEHFPEVELKENASIADNILLIYAATRETFIFILDEYDVLIREQVSDKLFTEYLDFLNGLFKRNTLRPAISLAYLTGILPIVRDKVQSKLNNFREYTMLSAGVLTEYIGFTSNEVEELCRRFDVDFSECRRWYDGYRQNGLEIYNPESVVRSMEDRRFAGYWGKTSSYEVISDRLRQDFDGMREAVIDMLAGEAVHVDEGAYLNTMTGFTGKDEVFTYLSHLGYLSYDEDEQTCRIPNREVRQEWIRAISSNDEYAVTDHIVQSSRELLAQTIRGDEEAVAQALDVSHVHVTSNRSYNNEDALQSAIYLAYIYALNKYTIIREMTAGKGYADVVFIPFVSDMPAMVVELKRNGSAQSAIDQIRERQYFDPLEHYQGDLLFVGIDYDEKDKKHSCKIERFVKAQEC